MTVHLRGGRVFLVLREDKRPQYLIHNRLKSTLYFIEDYHIEGTECIYRISLCKPYNDLGRLIRGKVVSIGSVLDSDNSYLIPNSNCSKLSIKYIPDGEKVEITETKTINKLTAMIPVISETLEEDQIYRFNDYKIFIQDITDEMLSITIKKKKHIKYYRLLKGEYIIGNSAKCSIIIESKDEIFIGYYQDKWRISNMTSLL